MRKEQADIRVNVSTGGQRYDIAVQCTDEYAGGRNCASMGRISFPWHVIWI